MKQEAVFSGKLIVDGNEILGDFCKYSVITFASAQVFVGNHPEFPLTVLGDPNPIDPYPVRNTNGASVGQVVGDGIALVHSNQSFINWEEEVRTGQQNSLSTFLFLFLCFLFFEFLVFSWTDALH